MIIFESNIPDARRVNVFFTIASGKPGQFVISIHYRGRDKAIAEMDMMIDDLLEKQDQKVETINMEYVKLRVQQLLALFQKSFT